MCTTRTYIFEGRRVGPIGHEFDLMDTHTTWVDGCPVDPRVQDDQCVWPVWEDIWSGRGGPDARCHYRVVVVPGHWSYEEMRESICWWGQPSPGQVTP